MSGKGAGVSGQTLDIIVPLGNPPIPPILGTVLGTDRENGKPGGGGYCNGARTPPAKVVQNGDLKKRRCLSYNGLLQDRRRVPPTAATKLIPIFAKFPSQ